MKDIKLVIWDLDETFWKGTLSEGEVFPIKDNVDNVKELSKRGIINSISSKNDYEQARTKLIEFGVWDYFIFPVINWNPKGENVKNIISNCQLRNENILFIDDNILNLREVEHYNEGVNTLHADELEGLLEMPSLKGKEDSKLSRLKQYKILEKKNEFKSVCSDNHSFLLQSKIEITFISNVTLYKERILELIGRTNQLNFTKKRINGLELDRLIDDSNVECMAIKVSDRFGDYGICGFYALNKITNELLHFLYSCRILNLGIERYVYNKLNRPDINVILPVSSSLDNNEFIDWITENGDMALQNKKSSTDKKIKLLFVGGCDLEQLCHYIDTDKFEIITDFNYPNSRGVSVHREHTVYLRESRELTAGDRKMIEKLPFGDKSMFDMKIFTADYDVLIYSVLMNYTHEVYRNRLKDFKVSYGGYLNMTEMCTHVGFTKQEYDCFCEEYEFEGLQSSTDFRNDLNWLTTVIDKPILFLNGAEIENVNSSEPEAYKRHCEMNAVLDDFLRSCHHNCKLIDIRKYVKSRSEISDTIRHYQRGIYVYLAQEIMNELSKDKIRVSFFKILSIRSFYFLQSIKDFIFPFYKMFRHVFSRM